MLNEQLSIAVTIGVIIYSGKCGQIYNQYPKLTKQHLLTEWFPQDLYLHLKTVQLIHDCDYIMRIHTYLSTAPFCVII